MEMFKKFENHINNHRAFLEHNAVMLDIYEGNLMEYVKKVLSTSLSPNYYKTIKDRVVPINIVPKYIDKMSKTYSFPVIRESNEQEFIDRMSEMIDIDAVMAEAEDLSFLHKGYALEPYLDDDFEPKVRVMPFDRFLPYSNDKKNNRKMTAMIKFMGKCDHNGKECDLFHYWDNKDFIAFTEQGIYEKDMIDPSGNVITSNPMEFIPFVYGSRAKSRLIPKADSDTLQITKMIPIVLTDMGGALMYQCFTIIYTIDVKTADFVLSPNAHWQMKSDPKSDKTPSIGTISPKAQVDDVLKFARETYTFWLESKGLRVGSMGTTDGTMNVSGISKIIDESDASDVRRKSIMLMKKEEKELWHLLVKMNNYWVQSVPEYEGSIINEDDFEINIKVQEPEMPISRKEKIENVTMEYEKGYMTAENVIEELYPDLEGEKFEQRVALLISKGIGSIEEESNSRQES